MPPLRRSTAAAVSTSPYSLEPCRLADRAVRVDIDDLQSGHEANRIEVVDVEVAEDAAGLGDVRLRRRRGIVRRRAEDEELAERACGDRVVGGAVAGVEAPLESDLDERARPLDLPDQRVERCEVERDRLLAEGRQAGTRGQGEQGRVPGRRGGDHECVDSCLDERLGCLDCARTEIGRDLLRAGRVGVGDGQALDAVESEQGARVEEPDPSDSHHP